MALKNTLRGLSLAAVFVCLCLPLTSWMRRAGAQGGQTGQGDLPVEQTRKNIQALKGLPESQSFPVMNFVSVSLGVKCDFCHVKQKDTKGGADQWVWESDEKEHKRVGRQMMRMTLDINKNNLDARGGYGITCYTCHRGTTGGPRLPPMPVPADHPAVQRRARLDQKSARPTRGIRRRTRGLAERRAHVRTRQNQRAVSRARL